MKVINIGNNSAWLPLTHIALEKHSNEDSIQYKDATVCRFLLLE